MAIAKILYKSFYWKIFQLLSSLIINIVLVRALQSSLSAEFYSLLYMLSLATSFFTMGLDISLNFYLSRKQLSPVTARRITLAVVVLALLICLPLMSFLWQPMRYPGISLQTILLFSACNIAGNLLTSLSGTLFTADGRNHLPVKISFLANCLVVLFSLSSVLIFTGSRLVTALFWIYFLFSFGQGLFLYAWSRLSYPGKLGPSPGTPPDAGPPDPVGLMTLVRFSFAAFITNFIFFAASLIGLYLLLYRAHPAALGNYIQAYKIVEYITALAAFVYYPFMALVAGDDTEKMNGMVLFMVRLSNSFVLLAAVILLGTGWFLFPFVFGKSFGEVYTFFIWLIPGVFAACASSFFTAYFFGKGRIIFNLVSACILFSSALVFFFPFTWAWGLRGAALAYSLASLLSLLYDCLVCKRFFKYRPGDLLLLRKADIGLIRLFVKKWVN
ncbi:MAG TPA: hypothetical protein VK563_14335 [Puia sp.]|nr:hypothetical protein [Puia sp.]